MNMPLALPLMTHIIIGAVLFFAGTGIGIFAIKHRLSRKWKIAMLIPSAVFVLYILLYLGCNFIGRMQVNSELKQLKKAGIKIDINKIIPVSKSLENGALLYEAVFKLIQASGLEEMLYSITDPKTGGVATFSIEDLDSQERSRAETLLNHENTSLIFDLFRKGTSRPYATYTFQYDGIETQLPVIGMQRGLFRLLKLKASYEALSGKTDNAYNLINDGFKMISQLQNGPFLISHLVNIACCSIDMEILNTTLAKYGIDNNHAMKLLATLDSIKLKKATKTGIEGEMYVSGCDVFKRAIKGQASYEYRELSFLRRIMLNCYPFFYQDYAFYLNYMTKLANLVKEPYWTVEGKIQDMESELKHKHFVPMSKMYAASLGIIALKTAQCETNINATKIALALHIYKNNHGQFPETLEALAPEILKEIPLDFTDGKPFDYKKTDKYFSLSSEWLAEKAKRKH